MGSSPRMRGTRCFPVGAQGLEGLIPAHAGNTGVSKRFVGRVGAHPRACGEHAATTLGLTKNEGSSPRMRGTLVGELGEGSGEGLIPAHAGNTVTPTLATGDLRAHPRACGEHFGEVAGLAAGGGSSPHMRGTLKSLHISMCVVGLIPAHAGNTKRCKAKSFSCWAHPRACGERVE